MSNHNWKFAFIKLPEKHFRRNRIAIDFFMGVATDIHCSQTLYRRWNLCWWKSWCGNGARSEWVINPLTHLTRTHTHFQGCNQDANLVGQNRDVKHPGGVRSVDGQEWVISPCFRPFSRLAHLYTYTLSQTLLETHTHRCKYFTSPTHSWRRIILFLRPRRCCLRSHRGRF